MATDLSDRAQGSKRRLACERCRSQKLKCCRSDENCLEPCLRCVQAQAECIVSLRKTPGRPAGRTNAGPPDSQDLSSTDVSGINTLDAITFDDLFAKPPDFPGPGPIEGSSNPTLFPLESTPVHIPDFADLLEHPDTSFDDPTFPWSSFPDSNKASGLPDIPESLLGSPETADYSFTRSSSGSSSYNNQRSRLPDQSPDPAFHLSRLQQELSKQLSLLKSFPWDITHVMKLDNNGSCGCRSQVCETSHEQFKFNPLTGTFTAISEFENILNVLRRMNSPNAFQRTSCSDSPLEMNVSYSLTAMSCYLQLVCIYDCIFSHVIDQASNDSSVKNFILHSAPKVSLGGFVLPSPTNIWGQLFVQLMKLKIKPVEVGLGLPEDHCICAPLQDSGQTGQVDRPRRPLLGGKQREALLLALKDSHSSTECSRSGGIEALREKMKKLESLS